MKLKDVAFYNLRRRKGRTLFLILTFFIVVGTIISLNVISIGLKQQLDKKLSRFGANIVISPKSEHLALSYGGLSVPGVTYDVQKLDLSSLDKLKKVSRPEDLSSIAPKVIGPAQGDKQKYLVVGVNFKSELAMKSWWKILGQVPEADQVVIGSRLAMRDKIGPGASLRLAGRELKISGVLEETGGAEDSAVFAPMDLARELTGIKDSYTLIEINAKHPSEMVSELAEILPEAKVSPVTKLVQGMQEASDRFSSFSASVSILLGLVGFLVVFVTLVGNVNDRTRELGIFRAIGFRQKHVLLILITEVVLVSLTGGLAGYLLGIAAPPFLGPLVVKEALGFGFYPLLGLGIIAAACLAGIAAIAYPAWRVIKMDPSESLRYI